MKDGTVAETGTHAELMLKDGDYAKLYNIQASAFLSEAPSAPKERAEADKVVAQEVSFTAKLGYKT
jgi:hypothetical protein